MQKSILKHVDGDLYKNIITAYFTSHKKALVIHYIVILSLHKLTKKINAVYSFIIKTAHQTTKSFKNQYRHQSMHHYNQKQYFFL